MVNHAALISTKYRVVNSGAKLNFFMLAFSGVNDDFNVWFSYILLFNLFDNANVLVNRKNNVEWIKS